MVFLEKHRPLLTTITKMSGKEFHSILLFLNGDRIHNPSAFLVSALSVVPQISPCPLFSLLFPVSQDFYSPYSLQPQCIIAEIDSSVALFSLSTVSGPLLSLRSSASLPIFYSASQKAWGQWTRRVSLLDCEAGGVKVWGEY